VYLGQWWDVSRHCLVLIQHFHYSLSLGLSLDSPCLGRDLSLGRTVLVLSFRDQDRSRHLAGEETHHLIDKLVVIYVELWKPVHHTAQWKREFQVLWSATTNSLDVPRIRLLFGARAFQVATPKMWNQLPYDVRSTENTNTFKEKLKTYIFTMFYDLLFYLLVHFSHVDLFVSLSSTGQPSAVEYLTVCNYNWMEWAILPLLPSHRASPHFHWYSFPIRLKVGG